MSPTLRQDRRACDFSWLLTAVGSRDEHHASRDCGSDRLSCRGKSDAIHYRAKRLAKSGLPDWALSDAFLGKCHPENLADAVRGMRALGFRGGNVTMPHKRAILPLLDDLTEAARLIGAVNCWRREGDRLLGDNTDGKGFLQSLRTLVEPAGRRIAILGAGEARVARSPWSSVWLVRPRILIVNRSVERGEELAELLNDKVHDGPAYSLAGGFQPLAARHRRAGKRDFNRHGRFPGRGLRCGRSTRCRKD